MEAFPSVHWQIQIRGMIFFSLQTCWPYLLRSLCWHLFFSHLSPGQRYCKSIMKRTSLFNLKFKIKTKPLQLMKNVYMSFSYFLLCFLTKVLQLCTALRWISSSSVKCISLWTNYGDNMMHFLLVFFRQ